jgi:hypothetical protein
MPMRKTSALIIAAQVLLSPALALADPPFAEGGTHGADPDPVSVVCVESSGVVEQHLTNRPAESPASCGSPGPAFASLILVVALTLLRRAR